MQVDDTKMLDLIRDSNLVSKADLDDALKKSKESGTQVGQILVSAGKLTEKDFRNMEALVLGIPFISLKDEKIEFTVLSLIPEPIARKNNIVRFIRGFFILMMYLKNKAARSNS